MSIFSLITEKPMSSLFHHFIFYLILLALTFFLIKCLFTTSPTHQNLPPSPSKLPVIGHLHKLGKYPHRSLQTLSQKHGPLMLLQFGSIPTLIVSSAEAAQEVMKTHDIVFADRPKLKVPEKLLYNTRDVSFAPYGEYWRQMKSICVLQLLSNKRVHDTRKVRENETALLMKKIAESNSIVDLSDLLMTLTNDVVSMTAFSRKFSEGESGRQFRELMKEFVTVMGGFDVGTYIPWLSWIGSLSGLYAKVDKIAKEFDEFLERIVDEHFDTLRREMVKDAEDFVDVLLEIHKDKNITGFSIDRESIKAIILDVLAAGTDTTYTVLEWAMTELLRHPSAMKKVQNEVRSIARSKSDIISLDDYKKMPYLEAVIKETLRLHLPIPLLVPREARQDVKFMGYDIAAGTMVIINAWAIGRDPTLWDEPDEFRPERFLNSNIDFRGQNFQFIPFGAGRRSCPGISFAMATNELVLANLLHNFNWKLPNGMTGEDLDMTETTGLTIHKEVPLLAVATPYAI